MATIPDCIIVDLSLETSGLGLETRGLGRSDLGLGLGPDT
jgi:hypothetical protein